MRELTRDYMRCLAHDAEANEACATQLSDGAFGLDSAWRDLEAAAFRSATHDYVVQALMQRATLDALTWRPGPLHCDTGDV